MNANFIGWGAAILTIALFFLTYRMCRGMSASQRRGLLIISGLASIPGSLFSVHYLHWLPETEDFYQLRTSPCSEFLILPIGVVLGCAARWLEPLRTPILLTTIAFAVVPFVKPVILPLQFDLLVDEWRKDVCIQSGAATCGAASTATLLAQYGIQSTEAELARECHSYSGGTEAWYMARAMLRRGLSPQFAIREGFEPDIPLPAIAGVRLGSIGHFITILERDGELYRFGDPLVGPVWMAPGEALELYEFTGFYLYLDPED